MSEPVRPGLPTRWKITAGAIVAVLAAALLGGIVVARQGGIDALVDPVKQEPAAAAIETALSKDVVAFIRYTSEPGLAWITEVDGFNSWATGTSTDATPDAIINGLFPPATVDGTLIALTDTWDVATWGRPDRMVAWVKATPDAPSLTPVVVVPVAEDVTPEAVQAAAAAAVEPALGAFVTRIADGYVYFAYSESAIDQAIPTDGVNITSTPAYTAGIDGVTTRRVGLVWADLAASNTDDGTNLLAATPWLGTFLYGPLGAKATGSFAAAIVPNDGVLEFNGQVTALTPQGAEAPAQTPAPEMLPNAPATTVWALSLTGAGGSAAATWDALSTQDPGRLISRAGEVGLGARQVQAALGNENLIAVQQPSNSGRAAYYAVRTPDPDGAYATLSWMGRDSNLWTQILPGGFYPSVDDQAVVLPGKDRIVMGSTLAAAQAGSTPNSPRLGDTDVFQRVMPDLANASVAWYWNVPGLRPANDLARPDEQNENTVVYDENGNPVQSTTTDENGNIAQPSLADLAIGAVVYSDGRVVIRVAPASSPAATPTGSATPSPAATGLADVPLPADRAPFTPPTLPPFPTSEAEWTKAIATMRTEVAKAYALTAKWDAFFKPAAVADQERVLRLLEGEDDPEGAIEKDRYRNNYNTVRTYIEKTVILNTWMNRIALWNNDELLTAERQKIDTLMQAGREDDAQALDAAISSMQKYGKVAATDARPYMFALLTANPLDRELTTAMASSLDQFTTVAVDNALKGEQEYKRIVATLN
jgi:hypothetical protein